MSATNDHLSTLLEELNKTVQQKGPEAVIALLRNSRTPVADDDDIKFVAVSVCNEIGIEMHILINEQANDDASLYAKGFIVYYLRESFQVEWSVIKALLKHRNQSYLWKLMQNVKTLKSYLAAQAAYYQHKSKLDEIINSYKSKK